MKFKKTFLIVCIIICIFSVASVSAGDAANQTISSADDVEVSQIDDLKTSQETNIVSEKDDGTFQALQDKIDGAAEGSTLRLENNYSYEGTGFDEGIVISKAHITIDGQGHTIDAQKKTRIFKVRAENVTIKNIKFTNGYNNLRGGAVCWLQSGGGCVCDCIFINNTSDGYGGAVYWLRSGGGCVSGCSFVGNTAFYGGGAIEWYYSSDGSVYDCSFVNNVANGNYGGAIYWSNGDGGYISLCRFTNNIAPFGGAIYSSNQGDVSVDSCIYRTGSDTAVNTLDFAPNLSVGNFTSSYLSGDKLTFDLKTNRSVPITNANVTIEVYKNNELFGTYRCLSGEGWTVDLPSGSYNAVFKTEFAGFELVKRTLTINKIPSKITVSSPTTVYNKDKYLIVSLRDVNNNPISGVQITVNLNGAKTYITDKNGQVKVNIAKLVPKTYNAVITFENVNYYPSKATSKVVVKKAASKITAKKKTFKKSKKIKKYTLTLKSGKTPIKKAKLTLKIKGKTYKAKTNKKGKATFKIKLAKKGKFKAVIKFKGNKYFKKVTKKVKITIR